MQESKSWAELEGFKVHFTQRNHHPAAAPDHDHLQGPLLVHGPEIRSTSIVLGEGGKRRFPPKYSSADEPITGKKCIPPPQRNDNHASSKKLIPVVAHCTTEISHAQKRKLAEASGRASGEVLLPSASWTRKRNVTGEDGTLARDKESEIFSLEASMTRKHRVQSIMEARNMIPSASMGDLPFKAANQEPGFYARGGLIPGSTNTLRASAKPALRKTEGLSTVGEGKRLEATYGAMKARLEKDYDVHQVLSLTVAGKTHQGEAVPSWEAATGCFLVAPEDEAF